MIKKNCKAAYAIYDQVSIQFKHNIETSIMNVCFTHDSSSKWKILSDAIATDTVYLLL